MKKTININLGGLPFIIDEDAYALLNEYLTTLKAAFAGAHYDDDLIDDVESRIAEIFAAETGGTVKIVSVGMVEKMIARIGRPEEIVEVETEEETSPSGEKVKAEIKEKTPPPLNGIPLPPKVPHRLYRDSRTKMLGGVCSGLATYFNLDVTWIRLAVILLFFLSGSTVGIAYIVMLIAVPEARTPMQFMELEGETPTITNIGKSVTDTFRTAWQGATGTAQPEGEKSFGQRLGHGIAVVAVFLMKCLLWTVAILAIPAFLGVAGVLVGSVFCLLMEPTVIGPELESTFGEGRLVPRCLQIMGGCLAGGSVLFAYLVSFFNDINRKPLMRKNLAIGLVITFAIGTVLYKLMGHLL